MEKPKCFTKGKGYLPSPPQTTADRRLKLWRAAIALFDRTTIDVGPFYRAGYDSFILEPRLADGLTPDLLGAKHQAYVACEMSFSPNKEFTKVRRYRAAELTPYLRSRLGLSGTAGQVAAPFFITTESGLVGFPQDLNAINVEPPVATYLPSVADQQLREILENWNGFSRPPPTYNLFALPESEIGEIKLPLGGIVRQRAAAAQALTALDAANELLGELADAFTESAKSALVGKVAQLLDQAAAYLAGYATWDRPTRTLSFASMEQAASRQAFSRAVASWMGTPFLAQFSAAEQDEDEEEEE